jgi:ParB-like chromosome segregation protein Spo0J
MISMEKVWLLNTTQGMTKSKREMRALIKSIQANGIKEPIKYVVHNGEKYIVDGHHRAIVAEQLGIADVPVIQVELPYKGYKNIDDLKWSPF